MNLSNINYVEFLLILLFCCHVQVLNICQINMLCTDFLTSSSYKIIYILCGEAMRYDSEYG